MRQSTRIFLLFFAVVTLLCGLVYVAVQQSIRQGANDPQIQMAEDAAGLVASGSLSSSPQTLVAVDKSLSPFLIVFDDTGTPTISTAVLDGKTPIPPQGVFDFTKTHGEDRITWQPKAGVRIAAVIAKVPGTSAGFVLAGRSLREVEQRESKLALQVAGIWVLSIIVILLLSFQKRRKSTEDDPHFER
ncbi:MAG TPA: hypothetical protein VG982_02660 [Candidatus Paceibacterota bacterium]|jgi:hypothetical protein|nr:hypothetical protein [Candidatus Paceibacterota bacterium]